MKINIYNSNPCGVTFCGYNNGIYDAPHTFEDVNAALVYCEEEIDVRQQAMSATIWDVNTGVIYATCGEDDEPDEDYYPDDVDESNYDPYLGCDVYETEPFCDMW